MTAVHRLIGWTLFSKDTVVPVVVRKTSGGGGIDPYILNLGVSCGYIFFLRLKQCSNLQTELNVFGFDERDICMIVEEETE